MNNKFIVAVLAAVCVALLVGLIVIKNSGDTQHDKDVSSIVDFSNQVVSADQHIDSLNQVNLSLTNDLMLSQQQAEQLSNSLAMAAAAMATTKASLASLQDQVVTLTNQVATLNSQVADLQAQNTELDQRAGELTNTIARLNAQIADTESKLAVATTNNAFLQSELEKQLAEKAELERKFNDLDTVRAQLRKLKDELYIARRMELNRYQNGNKKLGALLIQRTPLTTPTNKYLPNYDLDVEVGSDGSVKVIPPLGVTNAAAH
jgi:chromosome segregation ATPase